MQETILNSNLNPLNRLTAVSFLWSTHYLPFTIHRVAPNKAANLDIGRIHFLIRKNAHFFSYLVLGILILNALRRSGVYGFKGIRTAFLICVLYAISDEVHQTFVPGRSGEVRDVIIDSAGAAVGILGYLGIGRIIKRG